MFSATIFALSVPVLSRNSGWLSLHTIQFSCTRLGLVQVLFEDALELSAAKTFAPVFVRVTDCALSSLLGFVVESFVLCFGLIFQPFVKIQERRSIFLASVHRPTSFMFGGSFCTACPESAALDKSCSYFKEQKTPTNAKIVALKAITFSLLCIFNDGKPLSLSK